MPIKDELFLSILAMDAYNRGYGQGTEGLGGIDSNIGTARIIAESDIEDDPNNDRDGVDLDFYAIAYDYGGQTIISYRGTDVQPGLFPPRLGDAATGWPIGAGIIEGTQVDLARTFYEEVTQTGLFDGDIVKTRVGTLAACS